MDKAEYKIKLEEINHLVDQQEYEGALEIVDTIDWKRVKSVKTLSTVADVYEANKRYGEAKDILTMALDRATIGKAILYRLCEICIKMKEFDEAVNYYTEFMDVAPKDNSKYILKYKIYRARKSSIEEQIAILEEYKEHEYTERWAYELARLYQKAGMTDKCVEECDDLILWFSEGKYVKKASELKQKYAPLTPAQKDVLTGNTKKPSTDISEKDIDDLVANNSSFEMNLEKIHRAGAAIAKETKKDTEKAIDVPLGNDNIIPQVSENLQAKLVQSIRSVFAGSDQKTFHDDTFASKDIPDLMEEPVMEENLEEYGEVKQLEPEHLNSDKIKTASDPIIPAKSTVSAQSVQLKQPTMEIPDLNVEEPVKEKVKVEPIEMPSEEPQEDFDLEALLAETANNLASEVASGSFEQTALVEEEKKIAAEKAAAKAAAAREEAEMQAAKNALEKEKASEDLGLTREFNFDQELKALKAKEEAEKARKEEQRIRNEALNASAGLSAVIGAAEIAMKTTVIPKDGMAGVNQKELFKLPPEIQAEIEAKKAKKIENVPLMKEPILDEFKIVPKEKRQIPEEKAPEKEVDTEKAVAATLAASAAAIAAEIPGIKIANDTEEIVEIPDVEETEEAVEIPDVEEAEEAVEIPDVEEAEEAAEIPDVEEAEEVVEIPDVEEAEEAVEIPDVEEAEEVVEIPDVEETEEAAEIPDVEEAEEVVEIPDVEETEEAVEIPDVEETEEAVEIPDVEEAEEAVEIPDVEETEEAVEIPDVEETEEAVEIPDVEEAEEAVEIPDVEEAEEAVEIPDIEGFDESESEEDSEDYEEDEDYDEEEEPKKRHGFMAGIAAAFAGLLGHKKKETDEEDDFDEEDFDDEDNLEIKMEEDLEESEPEEVVEEDTTEESEPEEVVEEDTTEESESEEVVEEDTTEESEPEEVVEEDTAEESESEKIVDEDAIEESELEETEEEKTVEKPVNNLSMTMDIAAAIQQELHGQTTTNNKDDDYYSSIMDDALMNLKVGDDQPEISTEAEQSQSDLDVAEPEIIEEEIEPEVVSIEAEEAVQQEAESTVASVDSEINAESEDIAESVEPKAVTQEAAVKSEEPVSEEPVSEEPEEADEYLEDLPPVEPRQFNKDEKRIFSYFAAIPGLDAQITEALEYIHRGAYEKTSRHGNILIVGRHGSGKTRLAEAMVKASCLELSLQAAKVAYLDASDMNSKNPAKIVATLAGGFLVIERASFMTPQTVEDLTKAMEFKTDSLKVILEDEKLNMRNLMQGNPEFAKLFDYSIAIPVFTNDELVSFAKTYVKEEGYRMDERGVLALYRLIGENQNENEPMTIGIVKEMVDKAIKRASKGRRKFSRKFSRKQTDEDDRILLYEKDFDK